MAQKIIMRSVSCLPLSKNTKLLKTIGYFEMTVISGNIRQGCRLFTSV